MLSLSLPALTDKGVEELFASIPFHCIVLMEDIDATKPLTRTGLAVKAPADDDSEDEDQEPKNTVTLSGLLNAIDGVGAAEGRRGSLSFHLTDCTGCTKPILTCHFL